MQAEVNPFDELRRSLRASIARDLHDGPVRDLTDCLIQLEVFRRGSPSAAMQDAINDVEGRTRSAIASLRRIMSDLREDTPRERLTDALKSLFASYDRSFDTEFVVVVSPTWPEILPGHVGVALLRIVEEAATNAIRHAAAAHVVVQLQNADGELRLDVDDDGRGISDAAQRWPGGGMVGMRERAAMLGGRLSVTRRPTGTRLRVTVPLKAITVL